MYKEDLALNYLQWLIWHKTQPNHTLIQAILLEEQLWYYLTHSWEDVGVHTFSKGICPKVNVIA